VKAKRRGGFRGSWAGGEIYWKDLGEAEVAADAVEPGVGSGSSGTTGKRRRKPKGPSGPTYYISKMVGGRRYKLSTGADNLKDALHELDRFMADPVGYRSPAERRPERALPILLNAETATQFLTWSRDEKKKSAKWACPGAHSPPSRLTSRAPCVPCRPPGARLPVHPVGRLRCSQGG
jgi:hypothetical protein